MLRFFFIYRLCEMATRNTGVPAWFLPSGEQSLEVWMSSLYPDFHALSASERSNRVTIYEKVSAPSNSPVPQRAFWEKLDRSLDLDARKGAEFSSHAAWSAEFLRLLVSGVYRQPRILTMTGAKRLALINSIEDYRDTFMRFLKKEGLDDHFRTTIFEMWDYRGLYAEVEAKGLMPSRSHTTEPGRLPHWANINVDLEAFFDLSLAKYRAQVSFYNECHAAPGTMNNPQLVPFYEELSPFLDKSIGHGSFAALINLAQLLFDGEVESPLKRIRERFNRAYKNVPHKNLPLKLS